MSPLAEITTPVFRQIVRNFSPETHLYSEMLSAASIIRGGFHNEYRYQVNETDHPFSFQLLGTDPAIMAEAAQFLTSNTKYSIDINMGCSAPEILAKQQGAALLLNHKLACQIIQQCKLKTGGCVSVKMRAGYSKLDSKLTIEFAKRLEDSGADWITIHGRHAKQGYSRLANWKIVNEVGKNLSIPVIGNGDITDFEKAKNYYQSKEIKGIMIGRYAVQKPWIFHKLIKDQNNITKTDTIDLLVLSKSISTNLQNFLPNEFHKSRGRRFYYYYCKNFKIWPFTFLKNQR
jgi:tRNA-dihydrouridine synthase B